MAYRKSRCIDVLSWHRMELSALGVSSPFSSAGSLASSWTKSLAGKPSIQLQIKQTFDAITDPAVKAKFELTIANWLVQKSKTPALNPVALGAVAEKPLSQASFSEPESCYRPLLTTTRLNTCYTASVKRYLTRPLRYQSDSSVVGQNS